MTNNVMKITLSVHIILYDYHNYYYNNNVSQCKINYEKCNYEK